MGNDIRFRQRQFEIEVGGGGYFAKGKDIPERDIIKIAKTLRPGEEKRATINLTIDGNTVKEPMVIRRLESFKEAIINLQGVYNAADLIYELNKKNISYKK
jgi:hypothetical protein